MLLNFSLFPLFIANIKCFVPGLVSLHKYESSNIILCDIRFWRTSEMLVWKPTDTARKSEWPIIIVVVLWLVWLIYDLFRDLTVPMHLDFN